MKTPLLSIKAAAALGLLSIAINLVGVQVATAAPVDDSRMMQLEQEVRGLQRLVDQQARRLDALENALRQPRAGRPPAPSPVLDAGNADANGAWLKSANWDKVRPGMREDEVISALGPPTTSRKAGQGEAQTLFYSMELEAGGFLSGQVIVVDHRVIEVHKPVLK